MSETTTPNVTVESHLTNYSMNRHEITVSAEHEDGTSVEITVYFQDDPKSDTVTFNKVIVHADLVLNATAADLIARAMGAAANDLISNSGVTEADIDMGRFETLTSGYV